MRTMVFLHGANEVSIARRVEAGKAEMKSLWAYHFFQSPQSALKIDSYFLTYTAHGASMRRPFLQSLARNSRILQKIRIGFWI
jgi:hypothetical protein